MCFVSLLFLISKTAFSAINTGGESPIGEALAIFPTRVAVFLIGGEAKISMYSENSGTSVFKKTSKSRECHPCTKAYFILSFVME